MRKRYAILLFAWPPLNRTGQQALDPPPSPDSAPVYAQKGRLLRLNGTRKRRRVAQPPAPCVPLTNGGISSPLLLSYGSGHAGSAAGTPPSFCVRGPRGNAPLLPPTPMPLRLGRAEPWARAANRGRAGEVAPLPHFA